MTVNGVILKMEYLNATLVKGVQLKYLSIYYVIHKQFLIAINLIILVLN